MCLPYRRLDPKSRRIFALGNLSLIIGLLLTSGRSHIPIHSFWLDGICGLFLGLSIAINLIYVRRHRCLKPENS